jgi:hypothetical protein
VAVYALRPEGPFGRFADDLLKAELPDLPDDRRDDTVAFCADRAGRLPAPLRLGLTAIALGTGAAGRVAGADRVHGFLRSTRLPLVGDLARMVRSLSVAYVWERWPDTTPTGGPA